MCSLPTGSSLTIMYIIRTELCPDASSQETATSGTPWTGCNAPCDESTGLCTYTARVDLHASEFGHYNFDECAGDSSSGGGNMPDIGMELGKTYRFVQTDVSNYFHPLGFAYEPDGALSGAEELDEGLYLKYQRKGELVTLEGAYEPQFGHPIEEWASNGDYYGESSHHIPPPPSFFGISTTRVVCVACV